MFGNKELEAGMLAINVRLDGIQKDISTILKLVESMPELKQQIEDLKLQEPNESPFKTKEGLFNYKHRKPLLKE